MLMRIEDVLPAPARCFQKEGLISHLTAPPVSESQLLLEEANKISDPR
jgi:hypothetical protein